VVSSFRIDFLSCARFTPVAAVAAAATIAEQTIAANNFVFVLPFQWRVRRVVELPKSPPLS